MEKTVVAHLEWHSYRYYPYEKKFAFREVEALPGFLSYNTTQEGLVVRFAKKNPDTLNKLVYFSKYSFDNGQPAKTIQARLENGSTKNNSLKRQSTRYLVHGLHEFVCSL